ncbi:hypothetical protein T439DRAFT_17323 [Meredithblackwellia eburnea MCA 4105]
MYASSSEGTSTGGSVEEAEGMAPGWRSAASLQASGTPVRLGSMGVTKLTTKIATEALEFVWSPRLGRCLAPGSPLSRSEETITILVPPGQWVHVYEGPLQVFPWSAKTGNTWIKGQVKGRQGCVWILIQQRWQAQQRRFQTPLCYSGTSFQMPSPPE